MTIGDAPNTAALDVDMLQRLGDLLDEQAVASGGVPLEAADGVIAAAIVSPGKPIMFDECAPLILGNDSWADQAVYEEARTLLQSLWNDVGRRIGTNPELTEDDVSPVIGVPPDFETMSEQQITDSGYQMGSSWAFGFVLGADMRREDWERRLERDEDLQSDFYDIFALMPDEIFGDDDLDEGEDEDGDDEDIADADDESTDDFGDAFDADDDDADKELSHADRVEVIDALPMILYGMNQARLKELS